MKNVGRNTETIQLFSAAASGTSDSFASGLQTWIQGGATAWGTATVQSYNGSDWQALTSGAFTADFDMTLDDSVPPGVPIRVVLAGATTANIVARVNRP